MRSPGAQTNSTKHDEGTLQFNDHDNHSSRVAILFLIASGMLPHEIAHILALSPERTDEMIHTLCVDLGVSNQVELLLLIYSVEGLPALHQRILA